MGTHMHQFMIRMNIVYLQEHKALGPPVQHSILPSKLSEHRMIIAMCTGNLLSGYLCLR